MQQLQSPQVTQIAKMLEETRGVKDPSIIYQDKSNNRKLVYKIINKDNARAVARNASAASAASIALAGHYVNTTPPPHSGYFAKPSKKKTFFASHKKINCPCKLFLKTAS